ncbi:MAG TPA: amidophosphoribosyltransferase [Cyanobacteria bacterium UBA8156]|jgi:amidophosphoribosyltransferase|nr:amidophosphoribosyltransferase [Cyanobacteria bacterium UBA8156]
MAGGLAGEPLSGDKSGDKPEEACGVFGVWGATEPVARSVYFGLYALQHRGQESAGITTFDGDGRSHTHKAMGLVSQVFSEEILQGLPGTAGVGHTRYSTTGGSHQGNAQPFVVPTRLGDLALAHNGNLVNALELRAELTAAGVALATSTDSEAIAWAIAEAVNQGQGWREAIQMGVRRCQGAFSLAIATPVGLAAVRDGYGVRPLVLGQMADGTWVVASETCGLDIVGAEHQREVEPGELVWLDGQGVQSGRWQAASPKLCVFEMIYFARPDSVMHESSLYSYRLRLGQALGREAPVAADVVIGVPDSGTPAAIGYAQATGVAFAEGLIKNRYVGRTFIQPTQAMREAGIRMKLNTLRDVLVGKRVVVVDDSIVRGTTSRKLVKTLREAGATEVHMRISSPPVTHPCFYGIDTDSQDRLIAATHSVAEIADQLAVDSLAYLSEEAMLAATQQPTSGFCTACFSGKYPIAVPDKLQRTKLMLESERQ